MVSTCRHIHVNGSRCASPAMRGKPSCYWHGNVARRHAATRPQPSGDPPLILHPRNGKRNLQIVEPPAAPAVLNFPPLEDREAIQLAISMLCTALARDQIEPKRAALLLYGLQVASSNVRGLDLEPLPSRVVPEVVTGPDGEDLAA